EEGRPPFGKRERFLEDPGVRVAVETAEEHIVGIGFAGEHGLVTRANAAGPYDLLAPERFDGGGEVGGAAVDMNAVCAGPSDDTRIVVDEGGDTARGRDRDERLGRALQDVG